MAERKRLGRSAALAAGTLGIVGLVSIASAQNGPGGKLLRLTVGQSLQYSDNIGLSANPTDNTLRSNTRLGLSYSDVTRTQDFRFSLGGNYDIDDNGNTDLNDPFARLSYALEGANSRLNLSTSYTRADLDDPLSNLALIPPTDDPLDPDEDPVSDAAQIESGVRINTVHTFGFETGLQGPIGFRLNMSQQERRYSQTTDPDLFATKNRRIGVVTTFRIDPQITARATASIRRYEAEDTVQTDRTETSVGAGVTFDVAPDMTLDLSLSQRRTEVQRTTGTTLSDGLAYTAGLDRALPNGTIGVDFNSESTLNGRRNTLRATRAMTLPRDGTLSYGIGVTKTEGFSSEPLFSLAYVQPLRLGRFGVDLSQEARTDEEDDAAVIVTRASANYAVPLTEAVNWSVTAGLSDVSTQGATGENRRRIDLRSNLTGQINDISSWSAGVTLSDTRTSSPLTDEQQRRYGVQLAYRRELAQEWDMVARYQHTSILNSAAADRRSNAISLGLERTFDLRP